jgi:hypothetical protein
LSKLTGDFAIRPVARFKVACIRNCQPGSCALKSARTSRSRRKGIDCLATGPYSGRPRRAGVIRASSSAGITGKSSSSEIMENSLSHSLR